MLWVPVMASTAFSDEQVEQFAVAAQKAQILHLDDERRRDPVLQCDL